MIWFELVLSSMPDVLTAVYITTLVLWNVAPCNLANVHQRAGGTSSPHFFPEGEWSNFLRNVDTYLTAPLSKWQKFSDSWIILWRFFSCRSHDTANGMKGMIGESRRSRLRCISRYYPGICQEIQRKPTKISRNRAEILSRNFWKNVVEWRCCASLTSGWLLGLTHTRGGVRSLAIR
jgi:hypothetical protein